MSDVNVSIPPLPAAANLFALLVAAIFGGPRPILAAALFDAAEVPQERFAVVAAPIGNGQRAQLNIYEQLNDRRPCFALGEGNPAVVDPLLATFDFTGVCSRYIDANGYSLRVGGSDMASVYRLSVIRRADDNLLLAVPTKAGAGPEMVVARTRGAGSGFLKLELEPGWRLMRRQYQGRALGHVYIYAENWPGQEVRSLEVLEPEGPSGTQPPPL